MTEARQTKLKREIRSLIDTCCSLPNLPESSRDALATNEAERYARLINGTE